MDGVFWYVYMLRAIDHPGHYYVGLTEDLPKRLRAHNAGHVPYTTKFASWCVETAVAFRNKARALAFEQYLKSHVGRAFAKKHL